MNDGDNSSPSLETDTDHRWRTTVQIIEEKAGVERKCQDCKKIKNGLYWGNLWLCAQCIDESTIEGVIVEDRIVPRFSCEYQEIMRKRYPTNQI